MTKGTIKIHSENILPIIKKWLYSDKEIFVRELVSNACDALSKFRVLTQDQAPFDVTQGRIAIRIDKEKKTLTFSDNGIGMTGEEVEKYIAQIAFSGAEEFVKKYQSNKEEDQIIGHFGLGFYSAYMAASRVEIQTLSYLPGAEPVLWSCDGTSTYTLEKGERSERGTDIILYLSPEEEEYLDAARMRKILTYYCGFLPYPIYLNESRINEKPPLWTKALSECTDKEYLDFYRHLFPAEQDPLFWIHLNVDYPFHLKGILYFPKISKESELKKESIKLFCNRVFVSDNCKDLLPDYLMILRGAIDSPDIPLNVSRSYLQMDSTVRQLGAHISKKISDRLLALYRNEKETFFTYWEDIEIIIKYGALQDEKFYERAKEFLVYKNSLGQWTTIEEYKERSGNPTIYYAFEEGRILDLYREKQLEVLFIRNTLIDQALIQLLERKTEARFKRIDAHMDEHILDASKEKNLLDANGISEAAHLAAFFKKKLGLDHLEVEAKSLASSSLPAFLLLKEEERRIRDSLAYQNRAFLKEAQSYLKPIFVINTNSKLIQALQMMEKNDPQLAEQMVREIYDLARLSQREMEPEGLTDYISRSTTLLETMALKISAGS